MKTDEDENNILIISAHADDHIACAGTVFKLIQKGFTPFEIVLTNSGEGRDVNGVQKDTLKTRSIELSKASKFLGIKETFMLDQEDLGLSYSKEVMFKVVQIIRRIKPKIGIIMNSFDWHPDHREVSKIGVEAFKWAGSGVRPELGEFHKTPIVLCAEGMVPIKADVLVDITEFAEKKMDLWKIYVSQATNQNTVFERALMQVRGKQLRNGKQSMCEAFSIDPQAPIEMFGD